MKRATLDVTSQVGSQGRAEARWFAVRAAYPLANTCGVWPAKSGVQDSLGHQVLIGATALNLRLPGMPILWRRLHARRPGQGLGSSEQAVRLPYNHMPQPFTCNVDYRAP